MMTAELPCPTFVYLPPPSSKKTSVTFSTCSFRLSSLRSGSFAIKCSNKGGNATANTNHDSEWKNLLSGLVHDQSSNKDGRRDLVDSLRKTVQRVMQPEAETKKMKQVISQLMTKDAERVVQHETEIKKMKQELNQYKTRANEKLAQQETEIEKMKQELVHHVTRVAEIEECQKRVSEAITLVSEAELSLQDIMQVLRTWYEADRSVRS